jgi:hypothetical protein
MHDTSLWSERTRARWHESDVTRPNVTDGAASSRHHVSLVESSFGKSGPYVRLLFSAFGDHRLHEPAMNATTDSIVRRDHWGHKLGRPGGNTDESSIRALPRRSLGSPLVRWVWRLIDRGRSSRSIRDDPRPRNSLPQRGIG